MNDGAILLQPIASCLGDGRSDHDNDIMLCARLRFMNELPDEDTDGLEVFVVLQIVCIAIWLKQVVAFSGNSREESNVC